MTSSVSQATKLLNHLILGEDVGGVRFGVTQLLFTSSPGRPLGEPYINMASAWAVYPERPSSFPALEEDVPEAPGDAGEYLAAIELRHCTVAHVEILESLPHLVLTFTDGRVLFLWGRRPPAFSSGLI